MYVSATLEILKLRRSIFCLRVSISLLTTATGSFCGSTTAVVVTAAETLIALMTAAAMLLTSMGIKGLAAALDNCSDFCCAGLFELHAFLMSISVVFTHPG
jgi:hypothetical protein